MITKLLLLIFFSITIYAEDNTCFENRSGLDVGSGATKYKVFKYDHCSNKIVDLLFEKQYPIQFKESLKKSSDGSFSIEVVNEFIISLKEVKVKNQEFNVSKFLAVATEAFRQAKNSDEILKKVINEEGVELKLITQEEEALLGFKSAFSQSNQDPSLPKLMWDIGGGSMQLVLNKKGKFYKYLGKVASVSFKDLVLLNAKKNKDLNTPNPLTDLELKKSSRLAKAAALKIPNNFRNKISKNTLVVGVGGVFQYSLLGQLNLKNQFSLKNLKDLIKTRHKLSDAEINSTYATTDVTNLILVASFMEVLGIKNIEVKKANLTDALVLD